MKDIVENYMNRIWNDKDHSAFEEYLDDQILIHSLLGDFQGREAMKKVVDSWLTAFPDLKVSIQDNICANDKSAVRWTAKGTHLGDFKGKKPRGKIISYSGVAIYKIQNEKIVEYWAFIDMQHIFNQLT